MITYAQNFEDVMIARLFPPDHKGFYIDVGAADPSHLSVTKHFYDAGWQGINVEPLPRFYERLNDARPRDINVQAVIGSKRPSHTFFEIAELPENSTSDESVMEQLREQGRTVRTHEVAVMSLEEICDLYVGARQIDFIKIDVEGGELEVLESADLNRYRPVLMVIEAVVVNGREETWHGWEHVVVDQGYEKVWFDGLNNYYLRSESIDLKQHFRLPPNVFDGILQVRPELVGTEWIDQADLLKRVDLDRNAKDEVIVHQADLLQQIELDRRAKDEVIGHQAELLRQIELDRHAKDEVIGHQADLLRQIESDRHAKDEVIGHQADLLEKIESDRCAKQEVIDRLLLEVEAVAADRNAKQQVIDRLLSELQQAQATLAERL